MFPTTSFDSGNIFISSSSADNKISAMLDTTEATNPNPRRNTVATIRKK